MITRAYANAKGERQEISLTSSEWESLTIEELDEMLGFKIAPVPVAEPAPKAAPKPALHRKKSGGK